MSLGLGLVRLCVTLQRKEAELYVSLWDFVFWLLKIFRVYSASYQQVCKPENLFASC